MATNFGYDFFLGYSKVSFNVERKKKNGYDMDTILG